MANYKDVQAAFEAIDPVNLAKDAKEQEFRWHVLNLLFAMYGALDSLSHSYREMLKIQQSREAKQHNGGKPGN